MDLEDSGRELALGLIQERMKKNRKELTVIRRVFDGGDGLTNGGIEERSRERGGDTLPCTMLGLLKRQRQRRQRSKW